MINRIIDEMKVSLNNNCFIAALSTALTLPDICGRAEYGKKISNRKRYELWFDTFVNDVPRDDNVEHIHINGQLIWSLRNNALHEATYNINDDKQKITDFELLVRGTNSVELSSGAYIRIDYVHGKEYCSERYLCINVVDLCLKICSATRRYYNENRGKFNFMKDKIVTIDKTVRKMILSSDSLKYCDIYKLDQDKIKTKWDLLYEIRKI